jgi:predicted nucleic acid-binding Zn ribbon protein
VKRQGPRAVGDLLVTAVPELQDRLVEARLCAAWPALVGADAARRSRPQGLSNGCLNVVVDNSPWLHELTLRSGELTPRIASRFESIRTLRFTLGRLDGAAEAPAAPETSRPPRPLLADAAVASIRDPDVRAAARRLLGAARRSALQRGAV